jgi:ABC-type sugar transport system substrate-binding protein
MAGSALAGGNPLATPRKFMDSFYTLNNDYFNEMDQGAAAAAAALNITESLTTAIAESSLETMIASMSGCAVRMSAIAGAVVVRLHPPGRRATSLMPG